MGGCAKKTQIFHRSNENIGTIDDAIKNAEIMIWVVENLVRFHFQYSLTLNHVAKTNIKRVFFQGNENFLHLSLSLSEYIYINATFFYPI